MPRSMAAVDAQMLWMSAKVPNDQFLLFAFDGSPTRVPDAVDEMRRRAQSCPELGLGALDNIKWRYPRWQSGEIGADQFVTHPGGRGWPDCLDAVTALAADQLDLRRMSWRAHVFPEVHGMPAAATGTVVVIQIGHALGDGKRSAALAGALLGRHGAIPAVAAQRSEVRERVLQVIEVAPANLGMAGPAIEEKDRPFERPSGRGPQRAGRGERLTGFRG